MILSTRSLASSGADPRVPREDVHELVDFLLALLRRTGRHGLGHARVDVRSKDQCTRLPERSMSGRNLQEQIDTVASLFDHAGNAFELPSDATQAVRDLLLRDDVHHGASTYMLPRGIKIKYP